MNGVEYVRADVANERLIDLWNQIESYGTEITAHKQNLALKDSVIRQLREELAVEKSITQDEIVVNPKCPRHGMFGAKPDIGAVV